MKIAGLTNDGKTEGTTKQLMAETRQRSREALIRYELRKKQKQENHLGIAEGIMLMDKGELVVGSVV
jgi:hypothetical protein